MKKTYKSPQCKSGALMSTSLLTNSWSEDSRGGIDSNPQGQDNFGIKGSNTDEQTPWYYKK